MKNSKKLQKKEQIKKDIFNTNSSKKVCIFCPKLFNFKDTHSMINRALYIKYAHSQNYYYIKEMTEIMEGGNSKLKIITFKDDLVYQESEEYFSEYKLDSKNNLRFLGEYYKYHRDVPRLFYLPESKISNKFYDLKRRIEYYRIKRMLKEEKVSSELSIVGNQTQYKSNQNQKIFNHLKTRILESFLLESKRISVKKENTTLIQLNSFLKDLSYLNEEEFFNFPINSSIINNDIKQKTTCEKKIRKKNNEKIKDKIKINKGNNENCIISPNKEGDSYLEDIFAKFDPLLLTNRKEKQHPNTPIDSNINSPNKDLKHRKAKSNILGSNKNVFKILNENYKRNLSQKGKSSAERIIRSISNTKKKFIKKASSVKNNISLNGSNSLRYKNSNKNCLTNTSRKILDNSSTRNKNVSEKKIIQHKRKPIINGKKEFFSCNFSGLNQSNPLKNFGADSLITPTVLNNSTIFLI